MEVFKREETMKTKWTIVLVVLGILAGAQARAGDTNQDMVRKVENGLVREVQIGEQSPMNLEERIKALKVPGLSIAVVNDFQVQWSKGYGVLDSRTGAPVTDQTLFQVASITKCMGAVVALRLVQDGALDMDRDVNSYLKRWKVPENEFTRVEKVTLRRLLSHTAGLTVSGFRGYAEGEAVPTILQVLDGLPPANSAPVRVDRIPGSGYRYSGGGYTVLQLLLEDVTGRPLSKLVTEYVFEPAGMTRSTLCPACDDSPERQTSMGHSLDDAGNVTIFRGYAFLQGGSGCCELWTTSSDLARFIIAIQRALRGDPGSILSSEIARAMLTTEKGGPAGLGLFVRRYGDALYFNHDGGNIGFSARFIGHPERGYGFAVMVNSDSAYSLFSELTMAVAGAYGWEGIKPVYYKDAAALLEEIRLKRKEAPDDPEYSESGLNGMGYALLSLGYQDAAIGVFLLNVEFNPQSANCSDSLAEAYERMGDRTNALKYYHQAIDLLNRFSERNKAYERSRAAAIEKIRKLESEQNKRLS
jgi:CubicO group peptidase (beta-lactamase class C family)